MNDQFHLVADSGGEAVPQVALGEAETQWEPSFSRDGSTVFFAIQRQDQRRIARYDLETGTHEILPVAGYFPKQINADRLAFVSESQLFTTTLDPDDRDQPLPILQDVTVQRSGRIASPSYAVSKNGVLVYRRGEYERGLQPVWVDREGREEPLDVILNGSPWLSPDGGRFAVANNADIWIHDSTDGGNARRITRHEASDVIPVWSPDGRRIVFSSDRHGQDDDPRHKIRRVVPHPLA